jgi:hypothetical protein
VWSPYLINSLQPKARSEFAYARSVDSFMIYGGQGDEELLDDMHSLNLRTNVWEEVQVRSKIKPVGRKGSCMTVIGHTILIFGGKTYASYTNELWSFDYVTGEYELITAEGYVPALAYSKCKIVEAENSMKLYIFFGETIGVFAQSGVYSLDLKLKKWSAVRDYFYDDISRSEAAVLLLDNKILVAGGHEDGVIAHNEIYELDLTTDAYKQVGQLPNNIISAGMLYYESKLYIYGGSYSFSTQAIRNIPTNNFYIIHLNESCDSNKENCNWPCSKGTFLNSDSVCEPCSPGTYTEQEGSISCSKCPAGYYLPETSADTFNQCKLCDRGTYNPLEGQSFCKDCSYSTDCPIGSTIPISEQTNANSIISEHPDLYEESPIYFIESKKSAWLLFSLVQVSFLILLISIPKSRKYLDRIDIFKEKHNYDIDSVMYRKRTLIGGIFTYISMSIILTIIIASSLSFSYENIEEYKNLVPNVALERNYDRFIAEKMMFEYTFRSYGGQCGDRDKCIEKIEANSYNLVGNIEIIKCEKVQSDCYITVFCENCELRKAASIELILNEDRSFASDIRVKVSSSSSIPYETSSITTIIPNNGNYIYRGIEPSVIYLLMTPSLFLSEVNEWPGKKTGYHISDYKDPSSGSLTEISE